MRALLNAVFFRSATDLPGWMLTFCHVVCLLFMQPMHISFGKCVGYLSVICRLYAFKCERRFKNVKQTFTAEYRNWKHVWFHLPKTPFFYWYVNMVHQSNNPSSYSSDHLRYDNYNKDTRYLQKIKHFTISFPGISRTEHQ